MTLNHLLLIFNLFSTIHRKQFNTSTINVMVDNATTGYQFHCVYMDGAFTVHVGNVQLMPPR